MFCRDVNFSRKRGGFLLPWLLCTVTEHGVFLLRRWANFSRIVLAVCVTALSCCPGAVQEPQQVKLASLKRTSLQETDGFLQGDCTTMPSVNLREPKHPMPVAVVTGANRGLGLGTAEALARQGFHVVMTGRDRKKITEAAQKLRLATLPVEAFVVDVTKPKEIKALAVYLRKNFGRLDVLVNNAAVLRDADSGEQMSSVLRAEPKLVLDTFATNTLGPLCLCQALLPLMQQRNFGRIVNVSSDLASLTNMNRGYPAYRISKTALNALTRMLAVELTGENIKVNSVHPGWVKTDMGGPHATRSIAEGVAGIVFAATLPDDGPSGSFLFDGAPLPW